MGEHGGVEIEHFNTSRLGVPNHSNVEVLEQAREDVRSARQSTVIGDAGCSWWDWHDFTGIRSSADGWCVVLSVPSAVRELQT